MALSPFDVEHKTFRTALRGYAEEEVDEFLDEIVASLREYEQRLRESTERVGVLESELEASREAETAIRRTFIAAQRTADQMIEEARVESKRILGDARTEAAEHEAERLKAREEAEAEIQGMRQAVEELRDRLQKLADGVLTDVEGIATSIEETAATFEMEREFEIPSLVGEAEDDDIEYFDEEPIRAPALEELEAEDEETQETEEDVVVDLEPVEQRARPRRPWERDSEED